MDALFNKGIRFDNFRLFHNRDGTWPKGLLSDLLWICFIDKPKSKRRKGVHPPKTSAEILERLNLKAIRHLDNIVLDTAKLEEMRGWLAQLDRGERVVVPEDRFFIYLGRFAKLREKIEAHIAFYEDGTEREREKIGKHAGRRIKLMSKVRSQA